MQYEKRENTWKEMLEAKAAKLSIACWNVRSLVESEGSVETKIVLPVWELQRYNIYAAAISETKWFNSNVYELEGHVVLHSRRELTEDGEQFLRSEGVGIILSPEAAKACSDGGEQWEAVSPKIVTARLRLSREGRHHQHVYIPSECIGPNLSGPTASEGRLLC